MEKITSRLTVYFDEPFWVAVCELLDAGQLTVSKIVFGAEPKDCEIYEYFIRNFNRLRFSPPVLADAKTKRKINPKRMQRTIHRELKDVSIGTKAQQAIKLQQEQNKAARKSYHREQSQKEQQRRFELRQEKKKAKHKGK